MRPLPLFPVLLSLGSVGVIAATPEPKLPSQATPAAVVATAADGRHYPLVPADPATTAALLTRVEQALRSSAPQRRATHGPRGPSQPGRWLAWRGNRVGNWPWRGPPMAWRGWLSILADGPVQIDCGSTRLSRIWWSSSMPVRPSSAHKSQASTMSSASTSGPAKPSASAPNWWNWR